MGYFWSTLASMSWMNILVTKRVRSRSMEGLSLRNVFMKKWLVIAIPLLLLAVSAWAFPNERKHTRPPYSGLRKIVKRNHVPPHPPFQKDGKSETR